MQAAELELFWTDDESWILLNTQRSGSWLAVDQELPVRVKQTIGTAKSILTVFFNPNSFAVVDLYQKMNHSLRHTSWIMFSIHSFGFMRVRQARTRIASCGCILTILPATSHMRLLMRWRTCAAEESYTPLTPPISRSVTATGLVASKNGLPEVTGVEAEGLRNQVLPILAEVSEDETSRAFEHWIERCEWVAEHGGDFYHISQDLTDLVSPYRVSGVRC
jgi:hypothetical protein